MRLPRSRKSRVLIVLLVLFASVSAFALPRNFGGPVTAMPSTALDARVTSLLPIGPHTVTIRYLPDGDRRGFTFNESSGSGYLDLPADHDLTDACTYDIRLNDQSTYYDPFGEIEYRKSSGGPSWARATPEGGETGPWSSDEWFTGQYNYPPPGAVFFVVMDMFMEHTWCELRRLDQVARLDPSTPGLLVADREALLDLAVARHDAFVTKALDAADSGFLSRSRSRDNARSYVESDYHYPVAAGGPIFGGIQTYLERDGERVVLRIAHGKNASAGDAWIELVFTPTERREVRDVAEEFPGSKTYWEKVTEKRSGLHGEEWLNGLEGLRWMWLLDGEGRIEELLDR